MTYVGLLFDDLRKAGEIGLGEPLPPVLPIALYNGSDAWTANTSLRALLALGVPDGLLSWQPELRYLGMVEQDYGDAELAAQRNLVAALFRLERSRTPADIERVLANLIDWFAASEQADLRLAFVVWLRRVLLPARVPGADIPNIIELQEMHDKLAERVKTWTEEWNVQGLAEGRQEGRQEGAAKMPRCFAGSSCAASASCPIGSMNAWARRGKPNWRLGPIGCLTRTGANA